MGKWEKVDPTDLKPGDKVKCVELIDGHEVTLSGSVVATQGREVHLGAGVWVKPRTPIFQTEHKVEWFRRKPKPPTRPVEPSAGTVVRNVRTGEQAARYADFEGWWFVHKDDRFVGNKHWNDFVAPGDEIEIAEWVKP